MSRLRGWLRSPRPDAATADAPAAAPVRLLIILGAASAPVEFAGRDWCAVAARELGTEHTRRWTEIAVVAASVADLRAVLPLLEVAGRAPQVTIAVTATDRPHALRCPAVVERRTVLTTSLERTGTEGGVRLTVRLAKATRLVSVARAALAQPNHHPAAAGLRIGIETGAAAPWAAGDPFAGTVGAATHESEVHPFDVVLGDGAEAAAAGPAPYLQVGRGELACAPVDLSVCSPQGFGPAGEAGAVLSVRDGGWEVRDQSGVLAAADARGVLTESAIGVLRRLRTVSLAMPGEESTVEADLLERVISQLSCAGIPVLAPGLSSSADRSLGLELAHRLRTAAEETFADPVQREAWSVGTRRLAMARFGAPFYWRDRALRFGLVATPLPRVSVVLCTRRPAFLEFALAQIARQDWPDLDVVLVLHGAAADAAEIRAAVEAFERPLVVVPVPAEVVFGQALNAGLARCTGRLVTKMDDDDWYGPHHVTDLVQAHVHSGAELVGVGGYHVYLGRADTTVRFTRTTESFTHRVHGGTMLIATEDLRSLGGWRPVRLGEDAELIRMVDAAGGRLYGIHDLGFTYYRGDDHTWTPIDGEAKWLEGEHPRARGFRPPPLVEPLAHPGLTAGHGVAGEPRRDRPMP